MLCTPQNDSVIPGDLALLIGKRCTLLQNDTEVGSAHYFLIDTPGSLSALDNLPLSSGKMRTTLPDFGHMGRVLSSKIIVHCSSANMDMTREPEAASYPHIVASWP